MKRLIYAMLLLVFFAIAAVPTAIAGSDEMLVCEQVPQCTTNCDGNEGKCRLVLFCWEIAGVPVVCVWRIECG